MRRQDVRSYTASRVLRSIQKFASLPAAKKVIFSISHRSAQATTTKRTAKLYADFSLITSDEDIGGDAISFFTNMLLSNLEGRYKQLLIAPSFLKSGMLALIDNEMKKARDGRPCGIIMKMNSLTGPRNTG